MSSGGGVEVKIMEIKGEKENTFKEFRVCIIETINKDLLCRVRGALVEGGGVRATGEEAGDCFTRVLIYLIRGLRNKQEFARHVQGVGMRSMAVLLKAVYGKPK